jgi:uncharacterized protein YggE
MRQSVFPIVAALALLVCTQPAAAGTPLPDAPHVVVSGEGKTSVAPDSVRIVLAVEATRNQPADAKRTVEAAVAGFLDALKAAGVSSEDTTASDLSLGEDNDYDRGRKIAKGFVAERSVECVVRDVDRFNAIIDAGLAAGMNKVESVTFESRQADALRKQAREKAAADAHAKAEALAATFGAALGPVYSINSVNAALANGYGEGGTLDRIVVTGTRVPGRYLQPKVDYTERVSVVYELKR